jgi:hypothetical protein
LRLRSQAAFSNFGSFFSDAKVKCRQEHGAHGVHSKDAAYQGEDFVHLHKQMGTEVFYTSFFKGDHAG